jgi:hypothetical protein
VFYHLSIIFPKHTSFIVALKPELEEYIQDFDARTPSLRVNFEVVMNIRAMSAANSGA